MKQLRLMQTFVCTLTSLRLLTNDFHLRPPVHGPSFFCFIIRYRFCFAITFGCKPLRGNIFTDQVTDHRFCPVIAEEKIVGRFAHIICVAADLNFQRRVFIQQLHQFIQLDLRLRF